MVRLEVHIPGPPSKRLMVFVELLEAMSTAVRELLQNLIDQKNQESTTEWDINHAYLHNGKSESR